MFSKENCLAYIDSANLHKGAESLGWSLDYKILRRWIQQKFGVEEAFLFIGLIPQRAGLYTFLQKVGYTLVFKEVTYDGGGKAKGNCDADLVLQAARDFYERATKSVVLVSSDGDYASLVKFWMDQGVRCCILSPAPIDKCSVLLKRTGAPIVYLEEVRRKLQRPQKEKTPDADVSA